VLGKYYSDKKLFSLLVLRRILEQNRLVTNYCYYARIADIIVTLICFFILIPNFDAFRTMLLPYV